MLNAARFAAMRQDFLQRVPVKVVLLTRCTLTQLTRQHLPMNVIPKLYVASHSGPPCKVGPFLHLENSNVSVVINCVAFGEGLLDDRLVRSW